MKFHLHTQQGIKNLTDQEAEAIIAKDRESHQRDLYESIERGDFPRWTMYIQLMTEEKPESVLSIRSILLKYGHRNNIR